MAKLRICVFYDIDGTVKSQEAHIRLLGRFIVVVCSKAYEAKRCQSSSCVAQGFILQVVEIETRSWESACAWNALRLLTFDTKGNSSRHNSGCAEPSSHSNSSSSGNCKASTRLDWASI